MGNSKVAVIVAGSWGTALSAVLADNGCDVRLWTRDPSHAEQINATRENARYLPGIRLPEGLTATPSLEEALRGAEAAVLVAPSAAMREVARKVAPYVHKEMLLVHATKGFEADSLKTMSEVIAEEIPCMSGKVVVLSGPSHAEEVIRRLPTTVVVASQTKDCSLRAQQLFSNSYFRVYTNPDVIGVELSGALKNIIALAAGMSDGLNYGDNAKAALVTRGLAEIARLGTAMGANPLTFAGLAGVGDLVVTCTSGHSRNWRVGYQLGQGKRLDDALEELHMVAEGIKTTQAAHALAARHRIEMPITAQLHAVLFEGKEPGLAVEQLMNRAPKHELV
jgi:glycerol-3-phosphate dehydrogenase (NAD(P)+)